MTDGASGRADPGPPRSSSDPRQRFPLRLTGPARVAVLAWGVTPRRAWAELDDRGLRARFGWFAIEADAPNLLSYSVTGPYRWWRGLGLRISLVDRGLTFGSSTHGGVCIHFRRPVRFFRLFRPPAVTLTVDDIEGFTRALEARGIHAEP